MSVCSIWIVIQYWISFIENSILNSIVLPMYIELIKGDQLSLKLNVILSWFECEMTWQMKDDVLMKIF